MNGFIRRFSSLVYKETLQVLRDPSTILLGVVLPILLIILIGSGVTLDVKHVPIAVVMERQDSMTQSVYDSLYGSEYFQPIAVRDRKTAELLMEKTKGRCHIGDSTGLFCSSYAWTRESAGDLLWCRYFGSDEHRKLCKLSY